MEMVIMDVEYRQVIDSADNTDLPNISYYTSITLHIDILWYKSICIIIYKGGCGSTCDNAACQGNVPGGPSRCNADIANRCIFVNQQCIIGLCCYFV